MVNHCCKSSNYCGKLLAFRSLAVANNSMKNLLTLLFSCTLSGAVAQKDMTKVIQGWSFGGLPVVAYNEDFGLQFGVIGNLFHYGDGGERYPYYDHSIYTELTTTTRNDRRMIFRYDARELVKDGRFRAEIFQRLTHFRPFYGFNGYQSLYDSELQDPSSAHYLTALYYTYEQNRINAMANIEKNLFGMEKTYRLQVEGQLTYMGISTPNRNLFNRGKQQADLVDETPTLYDEYVAEGIIPIKDADGGIYAQLAVGGVIDTRDIEAFPSKGLFEEMMINYGAPIDTDAPHVLSLTLNHRHYLSLVTDRVVFAHRIQFQSYFNEDVPFYILQTLGGSDGQRGIRFARLAGLGVVNGNFEFRAKLVQLVVFGQNLYAGTNLFFDTGRITKPVPWDHAGIQSSNPMLVTNEVDTWHHAVGVGMKFALNENFVAALDYGKALDDRDGGTASYITLGWLF